MSKFKDFNHYRDYFLNLIELERKEEIEKQSLEISLLSGKEREKRGRAILGLSGTDVGTGLGGTFLVKLVRGEGLPDTEISVGDLVLASRAKPNVKEDAAVVTEKTRFSVTIAYQQTPPHFVYQKNVRLDLFANDITFQRMKTAVRQLVHNRKLSELILIKEETLFEEALPELIFNKNLNTRQKEAVTLAMVAQSVFLVHGPPGTGKSTTLAEIIFQHTKIGKKVLATADSNTAVDNMLEKLNHYGLHTIRIGNPARIQDELIKSALDYQIQDVSEYQQAISLRDQAGQLRSKQKEFMIPSGQERRGLSDQQILKLAEKKQAGRGVPDFKIRKMAAWIKLQHTINRLLDEAAQLEQKAIYELLDKAQVICATNSAAGTDILKDFKFDLVAIDEATQSTEPACLIPMIKGRKWVMAGDHKQLPPTVVSEQAKALQNTLFERWIQQFATAHLMLSIQYRMHANIMHFSNESFYEGKLKAHPSVAVHALSDLPAFQPNPYAIPPFDTITDPKHPALFIAVASGKEERIEDSYSLYNKAELDMTEKVLNELLLARIFPSDIGIISPYEQQVNQLKTRLAKTGVEIKTIDGFQGREKEVIILSLVRSNEAGELGFLTDYRRLNVALTRAKRKLIVIGDPNTLSKNKVYKKLLLSLK